MERKKLILVVDDEVDWRNRARTALANNGYEVLLADSKLTAIRTIRLHRDTLDLLVLDKSMGRGRWDDGLQLFRALRSARIEVPVIVYSFDLALPVIEELNGSRGMYVQKDWRPPQDGLLAAVASMLS